MKNICFIHIPKCGGTSIRSSMKRNKLNLLLNRKISLDDIASSKTAESFNKDVLSFREELLRYYLFGVKTKFLFGHFKCTGNTRKMFQDQWCFVTLIRDPIKRWLSHYYFDRYRNKNIDYNKTDLDLAEYLNSYEGVRNARLYSRHFSSYVMGEEIHDRHAKEAVENILGFDVYGILENMEMFASKYKHQTGVKLKIPLTNKNPKQGYDRKSISSEIMDQIAALCQYDIKIYQQVKASIDQSIDNS